MVDAPRRSGVRARPARGGAPARRPGGRTRREVPRDPRRRARPPHRQALGPGLRGARPHAARRGDRDPARAGPGAGHRTGYHLAAMTTLLGIVQVFLCVVLVFLILMHSGKDAGLSGAFGVGTGAGPFGGGSLVERNLNRWTIGFAIAFVINTIVLIKIS